MNRDLVCFYDILMRIDRMQQNAANGREEFFESTMIQNAVVQNLTVIAESGKRLS